MESYPSHTRNPAFAVPLRNSVIFRSRISFTTTPVFAWHLSDVQCPHKLWQAQGEIPAPAARLSSACAIIATQLPNSALGGSLWYLACPCCCVWNGHRELWAAFIPQIKGAQHNKAPRVGAQCFSGSLILHQPILHLLWGWFCSDNQQAEEIYSKSLCYGGIVQAVKPKFMRPSHKTEDVYSSVAGAGLCFMISGGRQGSAPVPCAPSWLISLWGSPASGEHQTSRLLVNFGISKAQSRVLAGCDVQGSDFLPWINTALTGFEL